MEHGTMVIAHDLTAYSEVIAAAVGILRPQLLVTIVPPADLAGAVTALAPRLVLASHAPSALPPQVHAWLALYPGGSNEAVLYRAGDQTTIADIDFATIMALLDEALAAAAPPAPTPMSIQ
jgi:hypothetical protein